VAHFTFENQFVTRADLTTKPSAIESTKQGQLSGEALIGQDRKSTNLSDRLAHQHPGKRWAPREVPREKPLVTGQPPKCASRHTRDDLEDLVDEQERRTMG
jgi:hypothetical protein